MFEQAPKTKKSRTPAVASALLHVVVLGFLLYKPAPTFVKTVSILHGTGGTSHGSVYVAIGGTEKARKIADVDEIDRAKLRIPKRPKQRVERAPTPAMASALTPTSNGAAGSAYGTLGYGSADGHEVRPAYPVVYPDPIVARAVCPAGVVGDVIVEVTIDEHGNIIESRLLQGLGHGVDERVMAVLQNWRYSPATRDGAPIGSRQDVHFHFPS